MRILFVSNFLHLQGQCARLLLSTHNHHACFAVCSEYMYYPGLMEATQCDSLTLRPRLEELLRKCGSEIETGAVPLATGCFEWLEEQNLLSEILALGRTNISLLETFLQVSDVYFQNDILRLVINHHVV